MAYRSHTVHGATTSTGAVLGLPAGHALNDQLLVFVGKLDTGAITMTGYEHVSGSPATFGVLTIACLRKLDGGAESDPTISFGSTYWAAIFAAYSGRSQNVDPMDFAPLVTGDAASATTLDAGNPTVGLADTDIIGWAYSGNNPVSDDGILATNRVDHDGGRLADSLNVGTGAFGTITWTFTPAATSRVTIVVGLKPFVPPPAGVVFPNYRQHPHAQVRAAELAQRTQGRRY